MRRGAPCASVLRRAPVPHAKTGKIIVANDKHEMGALEGAAGEGARNGVEGLCMVDASFVAAREPSGLARPPSSRLKLASSTPRHW